MILKHCASALGIENAARIGGDRFAVMGTDIDPLKTGREKIYTYLQNTPTTHTTPDEATIIAQVRFSYGT
jgi:GGDEF domain-containing protein